MMTSIARHTFVKSVSQMSCERAIYLLEVETEPHVSSYSSRKKKGP